MRQADIFLEGEGDAWLRRNRNRLGQHDRVSEMIEKAGLKPKRVLEVGCANGWRLAKLREKYGCEILGIDPSLQAGLEAANMRVPVIQSTASALPIPQQVDLLIYAFCLYLTDPADWLRIAAAGDQVLADNGHLVIHDFMSDVFKPHARRYEHRDGVLCYHFHFFELWRTHPAYHIAAEWHDQDEMVVILRKHPMSEALPVLP